MTLAPASALCLAGVSHAYAEPDGGNRLVLDGIDLAVALGEFVCLVGASGSGKTTLLRIAGGLTAPTEGRVELGQGSRAGFVFQADSLMPWRTVNANVGLGLELRGLPRARREQVVRDTLRLVKLERFGRHFPHELSGGMRQRVNIARALAIEPSILLMDEPFASLDAQTRTVMQDELLALCEQLHATVLFVTHQIEEAVLMADRIVVMSSSPGRIVEIVAPPFARPRPADLRLTREFTATVEHVWSLIKADVQRSVDQELGRSDQG
jgi:NitT/TauT family transport system ATP-binding protein